VEFRRGCVAASAGEAVGGGTDALAESVGAIHGQRAVQQELEGTVESTQYGAALGEGARATVGVVVVAKLLAAEGGRTAAATGGMEMAAESKRPCDLGEFSGVGHEESFGWN